MPTNVVTYDFSAPDSRRVVADMIPGTLYRLDERGNLIEIIRAAAAAVEDIDDPIVYLSPAEHWQLVMCLAFFSSIAALLIYTVAH